MTRCMDHIEMYEYLEKREKANPGFKYKPVHHHKCHGGHCHDKDRSSASCKVQDIQNIIFGPAQSRFWLYRKHMNTISPLRYQTSEQAFYSWECLTLQLQNRDINLVFKNQNNMDKFLKFLIYQLNILDGKKNSSLPLQEKLGNK